MNRVISEGSFISDTTWSKGPFKLLGGKNEKLFIVDNRATYINATIFINHVRFSNTASRGTWIMLQNSNGGLSIVSPHRSSCIYFQLDKKPTPISTSPKTAHKVKTKTSKASMDMSYLSVTTSDP